MGSHPITFLRHVANMDTEARFVASVRRHLGVALDHRSCISIFTASTTASEILSQTYRRRQAKPPIVWIWTFALSVLKSATVIVVITIPCLERRPRGELICPVWTAEPDANPGCDAFLDTCTPPRSSTEGLERRLTLNGRNRPWAAVPSQPGTRAEPQKAATGRMAGGRHTRSFRLPI